MSCEYVVQRAAASLPQSTTETLFTVSGGSVLILGIIAQVETVIQNAETDMAVYVGADENLVPIDGNIQDFQVGQLVGGGSLAAHNAVQPALSGAPAVLGDGATVSVQVSQSRTGELRWTLWYKPLDPGASVTAD